MSPSRLLLIFPRSRHPDLQCLKKRVKSPNGEHTAPSSSETPHNWSWAQTVFPLIWSNGVLTFFFSLHQKMLTHERLSSLKHWKKNATNQLAWDVGQFSVQESFSYVSFLRIEDGNIFHMGRKSQSKPTGAHHPYQQPLVLWILIKCPSATRPRAFTRIKQPKRKEVFQLCSFFLFSFLQCSPPFLIQNTSAAWSYSGLHWAFRTEARQLLLFLLMATWANSSRAPQKHLPNEAAMRSMLYDFQEQNSLQLAEGLVFDVFLWLFYNCLQIFSSFKLFWKVLGESQKLFCASMCLLAWIQESF